MENNRSYLYRHIRKDTNEVFYVGIGTSPKNGWCPYGRAIRRTRRNDLWNNIVSKTDYEVDIILENLTINEARVKEVEFIALYGRRQLGAGALVNMTDGGEGTYGSLPHPNTIAALHKRKGTFKHTEETKRKVSETKKSQNLPLTEYQRKKIIETHTGNTYRRGTKLTVEQRAKQSMGIKAHLAKYPRKWSDEERKMLSNAHKGKKLSEEHKKNISLARLGRVPKPESIAKFKETLRLKRENKKAA